MRCQGGALVDVEMVSEGLISTPSLHGPSLGHGLLLLVHHHDLPGLGPVNQNPIAGLFRLNQFGMRGQSDVGRLLSAVEGIHTCQGIAAMIPH